VPVGLCPRGPQAWQKPTLVDGISLITSGVGLLTGIKVCWFAYLYRETPPIRDISIQTFIGGVALGWVAIENALKKFRGH
jgi:hypothetical protein